MPISIEAELTNFIVVQRRVCAKRCAERIFIVVVFAVRYGITATNLLRHRHRPDGFPIGQDGMTNRPRCVIQAIDGIRPRYKKCLDERPLCMSLAAVAWLACSRGDFTLLIITLVITSWNGPTLHTDSLSTEPPDHFQVRRTRLHKFFHRFPASHRASALKCESALPEVISGSTPSASLQFAPAR